MLNKQKFGLIRNTSFAIQGLTEVFRNESSFKTEVYIFIVCQLVFFLLPVPMLAKAILSTSSFLPLFAELANSAIERNVDLVTMEFDEKAKAAKDAGSAMVFASFIITGVIWFWTAYFLIF
ncbi:diacylglycerol kinase [Denitrovibrio acetiphilus DSM 12809]|uniref:Diacylglycerol kinase n=1 Tax=Denitrovibrio acetiphilus (strain DSM 12809 / NBRC 114555 / N2460) TaxID=522772 RepID=D4H1F0_DENA2|nr:diacylglycerol kinase [Denitrovibrio acetiphilus]ADD66898.1 diacylglycerol kinase [Denitrovibrio acetiphilus DSM 12809]